MPKITMFDASIHLGQFCLSPIKIRMSCKWSQSHLYSDHSGLWTDNENGRVDNAIWSLPRELQDQFYPFMDLFFSVNPIAQAQLEKDDVIKALELCEAGLGLSFQSAYTCAVAKSQKVTEVHTLYADLLSPKVVSHMQSQYGILVTRPAAALQAHYLDARLEAAYERALVAFETANLEILNQITDPRKRALKV